MDAQEGGAYAWLFRRKGGRKEFLIPYSQATVCSAMTCSVSSKVSEGRRNEKIGATTALKGGSAVSDVADRGSYAGHCFVLSPVRTGISLPPSVTASFFLKAVSARSKVSVPLARKHMHRPKICDARAGVASSFCQKRWPDDQILEDFLDLRHAPGRRIAF